MLNVVSSTELKNLKNTIYELRQENKKLKEELKKVSFELGEWKTKSVLLEKDNKALKRKIDKLEKEKEEYVYVKENS